MGMHVVEGLQDEQATLMRTLLSSRISLPPGVPQFVLARWALEKLWLKEDGPVPAVRAARVFTIPQEDFEELAALAFDQVMTRFEAHTRLLDRAKALRAEDRIEEANVLNRASFQELANAMSSRLVTQEGDELHPTAVGPTEHPGSLPFDACFFTVARPMTLGTLQEHPMLGYFLFDGASYSVRCTDHGNSFALVLYSTYEATTVEQIDGQIYMNGPSNEPLSDDSMRTRVVTVQLDKILRDLLNCGLGDKAPLRAGDLAISRRALSKVTGKPAYLPLDFYSVKIPDVRVYAEGKKRELAERVRQFAYRFDRMAHTKLRVKRGTLPIDQNTYAKLDKYGYTILLSGVPSTELLLLHQRRGVELPKENEWIAWKQWRVRSTVVGDESLPYRQGLRHIE